MIKRLDQRGVVQYIVLAVAVLLSVWLYFNQQAIRDWWVLRSYEPPQEITELAQTASLSDTGQRLFYVGRPQLNTADEFNHNCSFEERSLILGCYSSGRIYVYDVDNEELEGIEEVTAAHEMLHVVYERLSGGERQRIDELTSQVLSELNDERLNTVLEGYERDDPLSVANERHSILGSEVRQLPDELEEHYSLYFEDRQAVVALAESYEQVFTELKDRLGELEEQISDLKSRITSTEQQLEADRQSLDAESDRLDALRQSGQIEQYNAAVPAFNAQVNDYNDLIADYRSLVGRHNDLVEEFNEIALEQNQLVQSINSKYQEIDN